MKKNTVTFLIVIAAVAFWGSALRAQFGELEADAIKNPVVIELFTSQSCSSCPPADKNLSILSDNPNVIALGFHVTYWNYLHWKDTLSREFSTERQRAYAAFNNNGRVYTPQMIVNGDDEFVGSNKRRALNALAKTHKIAAVNVVRQSNGQIRAILPDIARGDYTLWVAGTKGSLTQEIPSGENRGKTLEYKNAVVQFEAAGRWDGEAREVFINIAENADVDRYVILAQTNQFGKIVAAGKSK